jgi:hypothetical protein
MTDLAAMKMRLYHLYELTSRGNNVESVITIEKREGDNKGEARRGEGDDDTYGSAHDYVIWLAPPRRRRTKLTCFAFLLWCINERVVCVIFDISGEYMRVYTYYQKLL